MPLLYCTVDHALVQARSHLLKPIHILDFLAINPLLKNVPHHVIDQVEVWMTIKRSQSQQNEVWCQALEQNNCLLSAVSRCRILLEAEEIFNDGQKFLHEENFVVVQTIYFQTSIDETKTRALQC